MYPTDERFEKVEQITIDFEVFKKALTRNYLEPANTMFEQQHSFVLRLYPPFKAEMEAQYYESQQGRHYDSNWSEKPYHILPEMIILEGNGGNFNDIVNYPDEAEVRQCLTEEEIEEEGGIEESLKVGREIFWNEMKTILPGKFNLGLSSGYTSKQVDINWVNL